MKVLAVNASPHGKNSSTEKMLQPILKGMRDAGAITETIYLANKKIHHCVGCFTCWVKTPGKCTFDDDMALLLQKLVESDFIVIGTPLYYFTMTGLLKNFFDRSILLSLPLIEKSKKTKNIFHPDRFPGRPKKYFLVSSCGFPGVQLFDSLVATIKKIINTSENDEYLGEILRPAAGTMEMPQYQILLKSYFDLLQKAGKQLIEKNEIDQEVHNMLHQEWISQEDFMIQSNAYFESIVYAKK